MSLEWEWHPAEDGEGDNAWVSKPERCYIIFRDDNGMWELVDTETDESLRNLHPRFVLQQIIKKFENLLDIAWPVRCHGMSVYSLPTNQGMSRTQTCRVGTGAFGTFLPPALLNHNSRKSRIQRMLLCA
jgi:hypothetical protein